MKHFKHEDINKPNTATWTACNNDSKSVKYRHEFVSMFGGEFVTDGKYLKWQPIRIPEPVYVPRRLLKFIGPDNNLVEIDHMSEYCAQHNLNKAAMYEVLRGTRRIYKGYTAPPAVKSTD